MWKNYLVTAVRNLLKHKGYSFINVAGLTMGLTCCLIIFQYVAFEYSFDRFHENEANLYRVTKAMARSGNAFTDESGAFTPYAMASAMEKAVPEISRTARLLPEYSGAVVSAPSRPGRSFEEKEDIYYTDPEFLEMFTFPLAAGSAELAPGTLLLSESAAEKYFGESNPVGEVLNIAGTVEKEYRVAGVFEDVPPNSHLQFDLLLPIQDVLQVGYDQAGAAWTHNNFLTYAQLRPGADPAAAEQKMQKVFMDHRGEELREKEGWRVRMGLQPLRDVHLNADITGPPVAMSSYRSVYFFIVIGLVTLIIALLNYVNLATARALDRAQEVGVRKAVGAHRSQLIQQFLFESMLTNLIAVVFAVLLAGALTPLVNDVAGTELTGALWTDPWFWTTFLAIFGTGTLLAGLYPAFVLSSFEPASVMKGKSISSGGQLWLRRGLVVLQFAASFVLVAGTAVVYSQLHHMRTMDLGLNTEQVLTVEGPRVLPEETSQEEAMSTLQQELRRIPGVQKVATSMSLPGQGFNWHGANTRRAGADPASAITGVVTYIDTSFADLYGLKLVAGHGFTEATVSSAEEESAEEEESPWPLIANETAVRTLGFESPAAAVDQRLDIGGYEARIIGVVKDFNWTSAHQKRENVFFRYYGEGRQVSLRVGTGDLPGTISAVEEVYTGLFQGNPFSYSFLDEQFDQQYRKDQRFATLFSVFAGLAILIACLGLLGLASFTAKKRQKEIGIRKVLGASVADIATRLSGQFLKLVALAILVGGPVAYFVTQRWLQNFAYRIDLNPWPFLGAGALTLLIALATISYQSIRAATSNPADSIRSE